MRMLFEPFGEVLEVHIKTRVDMRGQCFVVFSSIEDAERALNEMQGFPLYFKPMVQ